MLPRSGCSQRVCLLRQQFHRTVRSSKTRYWNKWLGSVTSLSRRAPRLTCSLVRCTFRSPVATPDLCHMQWRGASCMASLLTSPLTTSSLPGPRVLLQPASFYLSSLGSCPLGPSSTCSFCHDIDGPHASSFRLPFSPHPVASPCPMPLCWLNTAGSSTLSMRQTPRRQSGSTSFLLAMSVTNSNHRLGEIHAPRSTSRSSHLRPRVLCVGVKLRFHGFVGIRVALVPPLFPHIILTQAMGWLLYVPPVGCELQYFPN